MAKELGGSVIVREPRLERKGPQHTLGVREWIPSKTIGAAIPRLLAKARKLLLAGGVEGARAHGHDQDRWDTERGDTFRCRFEVYLTDLETEPDHRKWVKEVAILVR